MSVTRTGGFAGLTRRAELETAGRPDDEHLRALARDALAAGEPGEAATGAARGVPDGFSYEITVDGQTLRCAEPHLSEAQRALVRALLEAGG